MEPRHLGDLGKDAKRYGDQLEEARKSLSLQGHSSAIAQKAGELNDDGSMKKFQ